MKHLIIWPLKYRLWFVIVDSSSLSHSIPMLFAFDGKFKARICAPTNDFFIVYWIKYILLSTQNVWICPESKWYSHSHNPFVPNGFCWQTGLYFKMHNCILHHNENINKLLFSIAIHFTFFPFHRFLLFARCLFNIYSHYNIIEI